MHPVLEIDCEADDFATLLSEMTAKPALAEHELRRLRDAFYNQGVMDRRRAAQIFDANRRMLWGHRSWSEFYLEALTDFFLDYQDGGYVLPGPAETMLLGWLDEGPVIEHQGERRLIQRILLKAVTVSEPFERRVLDALKDNLLYRSERWLGGGRRQAGLIDPLDMHLIRRSVHRGGDHRPSEVSRMGVDFLLDVDRRASGFTDPEAWHGFLLEAVTLHLRTFADLEPCSNAKPDDNVRSQLAAMLDIAGYSKVDAGRLSDDILTTLAHSPIIPPPLVADQAGCGGVAKDLESP